MSGSSFESNRCIRVMLGIGVLSLLLTSSAGAETIYDATSPFTFAARSVGKSNSGTINQIADAFVTSGSDLLLESITVKISRLSGDGDFAIRFWSDAEGAPGTLLESWTVSEVSDQNTEVTVDSVQEIPLVDGERYWVSIALPDDISWGLWIAIDATPEGRALAFSSGTAPSWYDSTRDGALFLRVTAVPEPMLASSSRFALACLAVLMRSRSARRPLRRAARDAPRGSVAQRPRA